LRLKILKKSRTASLNSEFTGSKNSVAVYFSEMFFPFRLFPEINGLALQQLLLTALMSEALWKKQFSFE